jgi:hypothetical protein
MEVRTSHPLALQEDSWYSFLLEAVLAPEPQLEGLGKLKKYSYLIRNHTHDLLACSIVPQQTTLPRVHLEKTICHTNATFTVYGYCHTVTFSFTISTATEEMKM